MVIAEHRVAAALAPVVTALPVSDSLHQRGYLVYQNAQALGYSANSINAIGSEAGGGNTQQT